MFKMKYQILSSYITSGTKRRSGIKVKNFSGQVAHDTGNPGSTARQNVTYFRNSANSISASAHTFVDDKEIIECIPVHTGIPEKAWHVLYEVPQDNIIFGDDANDVAVGVELCYGGKINSVEAYKRYVWYLAYNSYKFGFDAATKTVGHCFLDPKRKTDPVSGLRYMGKTYDQLIKDVVAEYIDCTGGNDMTEIEKAIKFLQDKGIITTPKYWIDNAKPGKTCDGAYVQSLLIAITNKLK